MLHVISTDTPKNFFEKEEKREMENSFIGKEAVDINAKNLSKDEKLVNGIGSLKLSHPENLRYEPSSLKEYVLRCISSSNYSNSTCSKIKNFISLSLEDQRIEKIPECLFNLTELKFFNLSKNFLRFLPDTLSKLGNLQTVNLSCNNFCEFPESICRLTKLYTLNISQNSISALPDSIADLKMLNSLDISHNCLKEVSESVGSLSNLTIVNFSHNKIKTLSEVLGRLKLTVLNISYNFICEVPKFFATDLPNLSVLDFSYNSISEFKFEPKCASKLKTLNISHNKLLTIPSWIFNENCFSLNEVDLSYNVEMIGISENIYFSPSEKNCHSLKQLKVLKLCNCSLTYNSCSFVSEVKSLESLSIGSDVSSRLNSYGKSRYKIQNHFWQFPLNSPNLEYLKELLIPAVGLSSLPDNIYYLNNLQKIDASYNLLTWLPDSFCRLEKLCVCMLSENEMVLLPNSFGLLKNLKKLDLSNNQISELPDSFSHLTSLEYLDIYANNLEMVNCLELFKNLKYLDLEHNYFMVEDLTDVIDFRVVYNEMKTNLRNTNKLLVYRIDGIKEDLTTNEVEFSDSSHDSLEYYNEEKSNQDRVSSFQKGDSMEEEECWSCSDDDCFDPELFTKPMNSRKVDRCMVVYESFVNDSDRFCPSDQHAEPMKKRFSKKKSEDEMEVYEGQFDSD